MLTRTLAVAVEIADAADRSASADAIDLEAEAQRLLARHPEAPVRKEDVAEVLREEADRPD